MFFNCCAATCDGQVVERVLDPALISQIEQAVFKENCCATTWDSQVVERVFDAALSSQFEQAMSNDVVKPQPEAFVAARTSTNTLLPDPNRTMDIKVLSPPPKAQERVMIANDDEYTIALHKDSEDAPVGLQLETLGSLAMVLDIADGPVQRYNQRAPVRLQVKPFDFVVDVNGERGDPTKVSEAFASSSRLQVTFKRPMDFRISIDKTEYGTIGLELDYLSGGTSLLIKEIKAGPVSDWNSKNRDMEVKCGDRIIAANRVKGSAAELLEACKIYNRLDIQIVRPS